MNDNNWLENEKKEWLLVELTYKSGFGFPGGKSEKNESPIECANREVKEEIGLDINIKKLLCIHYYLVKEYESEAIQFYFDGGILNEQQISKIALQESEIKQVHFLHEDLVENKLYSSMKLRFPYLKRALQTGEVQYFETKI